MDAGKDIDFILTNFVGGRGLWQWLAIFAMWPVNFAALNALVLHMFTAYAPRHRYERALLFTLREVDGDFFSISCA